MTVFGRNCRVPYLLTNQPPKPAAADFVDCGENNPHVLVGKEYYMISADGYLMPTKRNQPAPDSRYFNRVPNVPAR